MIFCKISTVMLGTLASLVVADLPYFYYYPHLHTSYGSSFDASPDYDGQSLPGSYSSSSFGSSPFNFDTDSSSIELSGTNPRPGLKKLPKDNAKKKYQDTKVRTGDGNNGKYNCHAIPLKETNTGAAEGTDGLVCYRCKEPSSDSSYEYCNNNSPRGARSSPSSSDNVGAASDDVDDEYYYRYQKNNDDQPNNNDDQKNNKQNTKVNEQHGLGGNRCENIARQDGSVCTICRDPITNGNYEQCSYGTVPKNKAYAYTKSTKYGDNVPIIGIADADKPNKKNKGKKKKRADPVDDDDDDDDDDEEEPVVGHLHYEHEPDDKKDEKEEEPDYTYNRPTYSDFYGISAEKYDDSNDGAPTNKSKCKTLKKKDGRRCSLCEDPRTGATTENCAWDDSNDRRSKSAKKNARDDDDDDDYVADTYEKSESELKSEKVRGEGDCREIRRKNTLCTVCTDPKNGGDYERCNYSYDPKDKVYAYTRSKTFGGPGPSYYGDGDDEVDEENDEGVSEEQESAPIGYSLVGRVPSEMKKKKKKEKNDDNKDGKRRNEKKAPKLKSRVDAGYHDAKARRDEIEKIVADITTIDKTKCKTSKRNGMTCYRCNERGYDNEECVYVADREDGNDDDKKTRIDKNDNNEGAATSVVVTAKPAAKIATTTTTVKNWKKRLEPIVVVDKKML